MSARLTMRSALLAMPLVLAACSVAEDDDSTVETEAEATNETMATFIAGEPDLTTVAALLNESGLASMFDGPASYTLLAPDDAAFSAADAKAGNLRDPSQRAIAVAILRDHILPGLIMPEDILAQIEANDGEPVDMTTYGDAVVRFSLDDDGALAARIDDGLPVALAKTASRASNGAIIQVDRILTGSDTHGQ